MGHLREWVFEIAILSINQEKYKKNWIYSSHQFMIALPKSIKMYILPGSLTRACTLLKICIKDINSHVWGLSLRHFYILNSFRDNCSFQINDMQTS